jgi:hypothetical protein
MKLSKIIFFIVIISMELQGAAPIGKLGASDYRSAAVIPIVRQSSVFPWYCYFFKRNKEAVGQQFPGHDNPSNLFTDLGARKRPDEQDPAVTAARALWPHQKQFNQQGQLADYLRRSPRIDMKGHIVYLAVFDEDKLNLPKSAWKVTLNDLIDAAKRRFVYINDPQKAMVHTDTGLFMVLYGPLAAGLSTPKSIEVLERLNR